jgi:hypothetical protein
LEVVQAWALVKMVGVVLREMEGGWYVDWKSGM